MTHLIRTLVAVALAATLSTPDARAADPPVTERLAPGAAVGVNANDLVLIVDRYRSYVWTPWSDLTDLGGFDPEVPQTRAFAIGDANHVVGQVLGRMGFYHPFLWTFTGGLVDVEGDTDVEAAAWAVNAAGEMVGGYGPTPGVAGTAFRRSPDGVVLRFNPLGGSCGSAAYDINHAGIAVGESSFPGSCDAEIFRPFIWTTGYTRDLGTLGGPGGRALRINSLTQVVGESSTAGGEWHAFLWHEQTGMQDLGTLGGSSSSARAINEFGHVVGTSKNATGEWRAFFWSSRRGMIDIGPGVAVAINEFDHVVGTFTRDGVEQAFLWTPVEGRSVLASGASAADLNNNGLIVGTLKGAPDEAALWRRPVTAADWITYRGGLVDAHEVMGTLGSGHANAMHAQLRVALRALRTGRTSQVEKALRRFDSMKSRWAPGELPWE